MNQKTYKLGFIGCGHMGMAIARGAVLGEYIERYQICVYDPNPTIQQQCAMEGFTILNHESEVAQLAHIVMLAVTPQNVDQTLDALEGCTIDCLLSIVTGVSISYLKSRLSQSTPVIRAMPNTPMQINAGATALCKSEDVKADDYDFVYQMMNNLGVTRSIPEEQMETCVAIHGSTPAYFFCLAEALINDAVSRGVDVDTAKALVIQTMIGSGKLLESNIKKPIHEYIDEVCSKGGTTIEAVQILKDSHYDEIIHQADERCIERAKEIGKK